MRISPRCGRGESTGCEEAQFTPADVEVKYPRSGRLKSFNSRQGIIGRLMEPKASTRDGGRRTSHTTRWSGSLQRASVSSCNRRRVPSVLTYLIHSAIDFATQRILDGRQILPMTRFNSGKALWSRRCAAVHDACKGV
jgi:hypothetical protein